MIKSNLARSCALDADYTQFVTNLLAVGNARELVRRLSGNASRRAKIGTENFSANRDEARS